MPDGSENLVFYMLQVVTGAFLLVTSGFTAWAFKEVIRLRGENERAVAERKALSKRLDTHEETNNRDSDELKDTLSELRSKVDDLWKANGGVGRVRT